MKKTIFILTIKILFVSNLFSQEKTDRDLIKENTFYFEINDYNPNGAGFDVLKKEIENAQFVILGEEHFSAKVSEFTNSIVSTLAENEFKYFAAEIGPNSASKISDIVEGNESLYKFNSKTYSLVGEIPVPFFDGEEDETFLKNALNKGFELWGIDQEYFTSQVFLIDDIYNLSKNKSELHDSYKLTKDYLVKETKKYYENLNDYKLFTKLSDSPIVNRFFKNTDLITLNYATRLKIRIL